MGGRLEVEARDSCGLDEEEEADEQDSVSDEEKEDPRVLEPGLAAPAVAFRLGVLSLAPVVPLRLEGELRLPPCLPCAKHLGHTLFFFVTRKSSGFTGKYSLHEVQRTEQVRSLRSFS